MVSSQHKVFAQEIQPKMLGEGHYSKQLAARDTISSFGLAEGSAGVCDNTFIPGFVKLRQNSVLLASVSRTKGLLKFGNARMGAEQSSCHSA